MTPDPFLSGVCSHCAQEIRFLESYLNKEIACPHCDLPTVLADRTVAPIAYIKTDCEHCNGHIEYPSELVGQSIRCPHCQQMTTLRAPIPLAVVQRIWPLRINAWPLNCGILALLICLLGGLAYYRKEKSRTDIAAKEATNRAIANATLAQEELVRVKIMDDAERELRLELASIESAGEQSWQSMKETLFIISESDPLTWSFHRLKIEQDTNNKKLAALQRHKNWLITNHDKLVGKK